MVLRWFVFLAIVPLERAPPKVALGVGAGDWVSTLGLTRSPSCFASCGEVGSPSRVQVEAAQVEAAQAERCLPLLLVPLSPARVLLSWVLLLVWEAAVVTA